MRNLFNTDNPIWRFAEKLTSVVWLNILWMICCIPIITIGPSTAAMYYVLLKLVRDEEGYIVKSFFKSFRENLKQGIIMTVILLFIAGLGAVDVYFYLHNTQAAYQILKMLFMAVALFYFIEVVYVFPVLAKFSNTTKELMKNALLIGIRHLPQTVLIVLIHIVVAILIIVFPPAIIFGMALAAFLSSYLFVKIFDYYIPQDEKEKNRFTEEEWEEIQHAEDSVEHVVYSVDDMNGEMSTSQILKKREQEEKKPSNTESKAAEEPNLSEDEMMLL